MADSQLTTNLPLAQIQDDHQYTFREKLELVAASCVGHCSHLQVPVNELAIGKILQDVLAGRHGRPDDHLWVATVFQLSRRTPVELTATRVFNLIRRTSLRYQKKSPRPVHPVPVLAEKGGN